MVMRVIRGSNAGVRAVWQNAELTLRQGAEQLGMSVDALQYRARALRLPPRKEGRREAVRPHQEAEFRLMWKAGVSARAIGEAFSCSYFAVINTAIRLDLEARGAGFRPRMTLRQFREARLGMAMQARGSLHAAQVCE